MYNMYICILHISVCTQMDNTQFMSIGKTCLCVCVQYNVCVVCMWCVCALLDKVHTHTHTRTHTAHILHTNRDTCRDTQSSRKYILLKVTWERIMHYIQTRTVSFMAHSAEATVSRDTF